MRNPNSRNLGESEPCCRQQPPVTREYRSVFVDRDRNENRKARYARHELSDLAFAVSPGIPRVWAKRGNRQGFDFCCADQPSNICHGSVCVSVGFSSRAKPIRSTSHRRPPLAWIVDLANFSVDDRTFGAVVSTQK